MKFTNTLLVIVALLLLIQIIDRSREPAQIGELNQSLQANTAVFEQLLTQQQQLQRQQEKLLLRLQQPTMVSSTEPMSQTDVYQPDGIPKPGVNFLRPPNFQFYDPDKVQGTLRSFGQDVPGTNDLLESYTGTRAIHKMCNEYLAKRSKIDPERWDAGCATACIVNEDYTEFRISIRRDVEWQTPAIASQESFAWLRQRHQLTAHDFVFTLDMITDLQVECPHLKPYYDNLVSYEAEDDHTLVMRWKESEFGNLEFSLLIMPYPKHVYNCDSTGEPVPAEQLPILFNTHWFDEKRQVIGVGAYRLVDYTPKKGMRFVRNRSFFGVPDHFEERFWDTAVQQPEAELTAFKNNQVHYTGLSASQYKAEILDQHEPRFQAPEGPHDRSGREGAFGWEQIGANRWIGVAWNCRRRQLTDIRVRQALAHLFPFERVLDSVFFGLGERCDGPVHPSSPYHHDNIDIFTFDPDAAAALLDEAGWIDSDNDGWRDKDFDGERITLKIRVTYYGLARSIANMLAVYQDECRKIGVDLAGDPVESQEWSDRADNRNFDGFTVNWGDADSLEVDFKQLWHGSTVDDPRSSNFSQWSNNEADPLIIQLRREFEPAKRKAIARQIQEIIYREQPYLFVTVARGVFAWHSQRQGAGDQRELLKGVDIGLDQYHPLFNRASSCWWLEVR